MSCFDVVQCMIVMNEMIYDLNDQRVIALFVPHLDDTR